MLLDRARRQAFVAATAVKHQTIEEVRQHFVAALDIAGLVILLQEGLHILLTDRESRVGQMGDFHHPPIAEVEHVADAAQYVVVDHVVPIGLTEIAMLPRHANGD